MDIPVVVSLCSCNGTTSGKDAYMDSQVEKERFVAKDSFTQERDSTYTEIQKHPEAISYTNSFLKLNMLSLNIKYTWRFYFHLDL